MASKTAELRDAVRDWLNAGSYSQSITAVSRWAPKFDRRNFETIDVSVIADARTGSVLSRSHTQHDYPVKVVISKTVKPDSVADGDAMMVLAEEIEARIIAGRNFTLTGSVVVTRQETILTLSEEMLWEDNLFAAAVASIYQAVT